MTFKNQNEIRGDLLSMVRILLVENEESKKMMMLLACGYLMGMSYSRREIDLHIQNLIDNVKSLLGEDIARMLNEFEKKCE